MTYLLFIFLLFDSTCVGFATNSSSGETKPSDSEKHLKTEVVPYCDTEPKKVVIKGNVVKLSEFLQKNGTFNKQCENGSSFAFVYIFALRKVEIDNHLIGPGIEVFILAPTWKVRGIPFINLNGTSGDFMPKPEIGEASSDGQNGRPGNPGNPGGNFIGIGDEFVDGNYLTISVSGGNGGPGQEGGDAGPGEDGRHADKDKLELICTTSPCDKQGNKTLCTLDNKGDYSDFVCKEQYNRLIANKTGASRANSRRECSYYIYGENSTAPGSGGDGGVGGRGGNPGTIFLLDPTGRSGISKQNRSGISGVNGKGGKGAAWSNKRLDVMYKRSEFYSESAPHIRGNVTVEYVNTTQAKVSTKPSNGADGKNSFQMVEPAPAEKITLVKIASVLSEYAAFVKEHKSRQ